MKDYLLKFRAGAFEGAMALFRRILLPNFVLSIIMSLTALAILTPLALAAFGISLADFLNMGENMQEFSKKAQSGEDVQAFLSTLFGTFNFGLVFLMFIIGLLLYCWMFSAYFQLNDNEVKSGNNSMFSALSMSFSKRIFTILAYVLVYLLINIAVLAVFMFLIVLLMKAASILGGFMAFILFFVVIIFMIRLSLGLPAIVHGNMTVSEALSFSLRHLTWKRAGMIFLVGIIVMIILVIVTSIISLITFSIVNKDSHSVAFLIVNQIFSTITSALIGSFIYASMTTLYFRYSNDEIEEENMDRHLVSED